MKDLFLKSIIVLTVGVPLLALSSCSDAKKKAQPSYEHFVAVVADEKSDPHDPSEMMLEEFEGKIARDLQSRWKTSSIGNEFYNCDFTCTVRSSGEIVNVKPVKNHCSVKHMNQCKKILQQSSPVKNVPSWLKHDINIYFRFSEEPLFSWDDGAGVK